MNLKPLVIASSSSRTRPRNHSQVACTSLQSPRKSASQSGVVLAVGEGKVNNEGEHLPMPVKAGDHVPGGKYGGTGSRC